VARAVDASSALLDGGTFNVAAMLSHGPLPIYLSWDDQRRLIYPKEDLAAAILDPQGPHDPALVEQGKAWMAKYEPFARLADEAARQAGSQAAG